MNSAAPPSAWMPIAYRMHEEPDWRAVPGAALTVEEARYAPLRPPLRMRKLRDRARRSRRGGVLFLPRAGRPVTGRCLACWPVLVMEAGDGVE